MSHKYRIDTNTFYPDGSYRRSYYFSDSIAAIVRAFDNNPRITGWERHSARQFDTYNGCNHTCHHVTRIY